MWEDALITASSAVATSVEDLLKSHEMKSPLDFQSVVLCQIDIITLLGFISSELSYRRKEALCPQLHQSINLPAVALHNPPHSYSVMIYQK